jgi:hypothetical protein
MDHELSIDLVLQSNYRRILGTSRMTRELIIIVAMKATIEGTVKIILQP